MKRKTIYLLQCIVVILLLACSEDDLQSLQAAFESDLQEVTIGESITFKDISTGEPSKWNWRFEGGEPETSILFSPNVVYNKPGVYSVTLSVGRGEEANEMVKEQYITVNYPSQITVDFSANKTTATNEDVISFKDLSKGYPNEWLWSFTPKEGGAVITSTEQNPQMTLSPGIYTIKLIAYNVFPYFSDSLYYSYLLGASASVLAIVVATAVRAPEYRVNFMFIGTVRLKYVALFMVVTDLLFMTSGNAGGHIAHLGGALAGWWFASGLSRGHDATSWINRCLDCFSEGLSFRRQSKKPKMKVHYGDKAKDYDYNARKKQQSEEIDRILDKLKKSGYNSLTTEEKKSLFDASKK